MRASSTIFTLGLVGVLASCSLFNSASNGDSKYPNSMQIVTVTDSIKPISTKSPQIKQPNSKTTIHNGRKPSTSQLTDGQWTIYSIAGKKTMAEDDAPYVNFDKEGRVYAYDGCNYINGSYTLKNSGNIVFSNIAATMKYCPEVEYSSAIMAMFADGVNLLVDTKTVGLDTYLKLRNPQGMTMELRRNNMEFLNGNWQMVQLNGKPLDIPDATIFIDVAERKVHGNTGCNFFNGELYFDPQRQGAIDFSDMGLTRMACPEALTEQAIMVAFEQTAIAVKDKDNATVKLQDRKGKTLMVLKSIPVDSQQ